MKFYDTTPRVDFIGRRIGNVTIKRVLTIRKKRSDQERFRRASKVAGENNESSLHDCSTSPTANRIRHAFTSNTEIEVKRRLTLSCPRGTYLDRSNSNRSNFFVFQSCKLRFSEILYSILIRSFLSFFIKQPSRKSSKKY